MEADESCVIVGNRKSLPQVYIATEAETGSYNLRHRYSSGSSSTGTPNCTTPPLSTSTPHQKVTTMPSFGTPGCASIGYGSFQPTSYTDAYVPPLSLQNEKYTGQYQHYSPTKSEGLIRIDSGYGGRFTNRYDSNFGSLYSLHFLCSVPLHSACQRATSPTSLSLTPAYGIPWCPRLCRISDRSSGEDQVI